MPTPVSSPTLNLTLVQSRVQLGLLIAAHAAAVVLLLATDILPAWKLPGTLMLLLHGLYAYRRTGIVRRIRQLTYRQQSYSVVLADGSTAATQIRPYFLMPWLMILEVQLHGRRHFLPLFSDSSEADDLRRLRVLLRCGHGAA